MKAKSPLLLFLLCFSVLSVEAQINVFEPCNSSRSASNNLILGGSAYFTSGIDDPAGFGYLRLTNIIAKTNHPLKFKTNRPLIAAHAHLADYPPNLSTANLT